MPVEKKGTYNFSIAHSGCRNGRSVGYSSIKCISNTVAEGISMPSNEYLHRYLQVAIRDVLCHPSEASTHTSCQSSRYPSRAAWHGWPLAWELFFAVKTSARFFLVRGSANPPGPDEQITSKKPGISHAESILDGNSTSSSHLAPQGEKYIERRPRPSQLPSSRPQNSSHSCP